MNLDFVMIIISSVFVYNGYSKGFLKQVSTLFAGIASCFITKVFYVSIHDYLVDNHILSPKISYILKIILIVIMIFIFIKLSVHIIEQFLKTINLNFTNRFTGALFGFVQAILSLSLINFILVEFDVISLPSQTIHFSYSQLLYEIGSILIKSYLM